MAEFTKIGHSAFNRIPRELHHQILILCPDPQTLRSLALSCAAFYFAFKSQETEITTAIVSRLIHPTVAAEAVIALASSRLPQDDPNAYWRFRDQHLRSRNPAPATWSLIDALLVARLQDHVSYFSGTILQGMLQGLPFTQPAADPISKPSSPEKENSCACPPSTLEVYRLQRALYRFQVICDLFARDSECRNRRRQYDFAESRDIWADYFPAFAAYEIEQLFCLNSFFMRMVAPWFNEIALHDVSWGYFGIPLIINEQSEYGQQVLSRGLETLHSLSEAKTYQERRNILHRGDGREDEPLRTSNFLSEKEFELHPASDLDDVDFFLPLESLPPELKARLIRSPFYPDPDIGPAKAWEWARRMDSVANVITGRPLREHHIWGYVLWDMARLDKLGLFSENEDAKSLQLPRILNYLPVDFNMEAVQSSQQRRRKIWEQGGSGWWSAEDESKVAYPQRQKTTTLGPLASNGSMQSAKSFLRGLKLPNTVPREKRE